MQHGKRIAGGRTDCKGVFPERLEQSTTISMAGNSQHVRPSTLELEPAMFSNGIMDLTIPRDRQTLTLSRMHITRRFFFDIRFMRGRGQPG